MNSTANNDVTSFPFPAGDAEPVVRGPLSVHVYLPFAVFYFFFNQAGLPLGAFYTMFLSPLLFLWLYLKGQHWVTMKFLLCLSPFILAHLFLGIGSYGYYLRSLLVLWSAYVTTYAICFGLLKHNQIDRLFDELIILNFSVSFVALACLPTPLWSHFWHDDAYQIVGASHLYRLSLLSSEPSVYSDLMLPLLVFATLRVIRYRGKRNMLFLLMIAIPFLLCQSFGGISMYTAAIGVAFLSAYRKVFLRRNTLLLSVGFAFALGIILFTPNPISERVMQVVTGGDSSTKSRTILSFVVAYIVASTKSLWWGVGLGQAKLVDVSNLQIGFTIGSIPNAMAGTFAELGFVGVLVRFGVEFFLFFRTKVYRSSFRLAMFVIAFIAQLTGSHLMDVQHYLTWCFAFFPFFPELTLADRKELQSS